MTTTVKEVSVNTNVNFVKTINSVDTRISYSYQGDTLPTTISANANAQGQGGVSMNLNLYFNPDGTYSPTGESDCAPFNSNYYAALKAFAVKVFENYKTPDAL